MSSALADATRLQRVVGACADDYRAADGQEGAKKAALKCMRDNARKSMRKSKAAMVWGAALHDMRPAAVRRARNGFSP